MISVEQYTDNGTQGTVLSTIRLTFDAYCRPKHRKQRDVNAGLTCNLLWNDYVYGTNGFLVRELVQQRDYPFALAERSDWYVSYDKQGRLIAVLAKATPVTSTNPAYRETYQYTNAIKQVNRYHCDLDSTKCLLQSTLLDEQQTFPVVDQTKDS